MENLIWIVLIILAILIGLKLFVGKNSEDVSKRIENDAKRFARLLVTEIKLYETYKVERGIKNNSLAESLTDEIAEARKKYKSRFKQPELETYFDEALIEILAEGEISKMGKEFSLSKKSHKN